MVSFSLRLRISYLLLQDSSLVSFHLIQFASGNFHRFLLHCLFVARYHVARLVVRFRAQRPAI